MSREAVYKITVLNWEKYNKNMKRGHKATLIANNFCSDAMLRAVPVTVRWMFLGIVLTCGDHTRDTIEMGEKQLRDLLESSWSVQRALDALKELQVLTYDKITILLNRIEKNRIEEKGKEKKLRKGGENSKTASPLSAKEPIGKILMARYCELWKSRYGTNPSVQKHHPKILKDVGEQNGKDRSLALLEAFFKMPDSWFVKKGHDIPTFVSNLAPLTRFLETGKVVTNSEAKQIDNAVSSQNTLDALRRGEI